MNTAGLLLVALLLPAQQSDASKKADESLGKIRASIRHINEVKQRHARLQQESRRETDPEKQKGLKAEMEQIRREFEVVVGRTNKSIESLLESTGTAIDADPKDAELRKVRAKTYLILGRNDEALDDMEKALELTPKDTELRLKVGATQHQVNRFERAIATLEPLLADGPLGLEARRIDALCRYATHDFDEAEKRLGALLKEKLDPQQRQTAEGYHRMAQECGGLWKSEVERREREKEADDLPRVRLTTSKGKVDIELFENEAPNTVANFVELVTRKFYDGLPFHRILPNFMAQGGCPKGNGTGDPGYRFRDELGPDHRKHFRGSLSMANSGANTNGSQFFITHLPTSWLNGKHTVFGRVIVGQEVVDRLQVGDKIEKAEVIRKRDHEYSVKKLGK